METVNRSQSIFTPESIRDFSESLKAWVDSRTSAKFLYYGSYFYDINGNRYPEDVNEWSSDDLKRLYMERAKSIPLYITEIIQKKYLERQEQILHLFLGADNTPRCECISCKITDGESRSFSTDGSLPPLSKAGKKEESAIRATFQAHYQFIESARQDIHIYFIPTVITLSNDKVIMNVATFICAFKLHFATIDRLQGALSYCSLGLISNTIEYLSWKANQEALKTAKAAIMSRNMSHNLGSHVMAYLKQHLSSVTAIVDSRSLYELFGDREEFERFFSYAKETYDRFQAVEKASDLSMPFFVGLGHFISYLQERQDFIATIATSYIPYYATVNFKDFIYDELNPDKRYDRHKERHGAKMDNILLGNLARSEGLGRAAGPADTDRMSDIVLSFGSFNGDKPEEGSDAERDLARMRDIEISLPGGVVGRQAIFSIIENIIRNAAKHGKWRAAGKLDINFQILTKEDIDRDAQSRERWLKKFHYFSSQDQVGDARSLWQVLEEDYADAEDAADLYYLIITDNLDYDDPVIRKIEEARKEPYIDERSGTMKEGNKGIKEIRISASWIRSISDDLNVKGRAPVVQMRLSREKDAFGDKRADHLQYIICLPKPRKVALISDTRYSESLDERYRKSAFRVFTTRGYEVERNKSFEFVLFDGDAENEEYKKLRALSSSRFYTLSDVAGITPDDLQSKFNPEKILEELNRKLSGYDEKAGDAIAIHDYKVSLREEDRQAVAGKVFVSDGGAVKPYLYRTHHEDLGPYEEFLRNTDGVYNCCRFVEGISGSNSTDRFVRNERIDLNWFYRHLHAMKESVAIFDERFFSKVYGIEESDITLGGLSRYAKDVNVFRQQLTAEFPAGSWDNSSYGELAEALRKRHPEALSVDTVESDSLQGVVFRQKGIHVFTLIRDVSDPRSFNLYGMYHSQPGTQFDMSETYFKPTGSQAPGSRCQCTKLAVLSWNGKEIVLEPSSASDWIGKFDAISIHQGLLDKLYDAFGIKEKEKSREKEALTRSFYRQFARKDQAFEIKKEPYVQWFLPGLCIHSGRSKPGSDDMPQRIPFIQYSALENAVFDSKYSLVSLLDFARYEN